MSEFQLKPADPGPVSIHPAKHGGYVVHEDAQQGMWCGPLYAGELEAVLGFLRLRFMDQMQLAPSVLNDPDVVDLRNMAESRVAKEWNEGAAAAKGEAAAKKVADKVRITSTSQTVAIRELAARIVRAAIIPHQATLLSEADASLLVETFPELVTLAK